MIQDWKINDPVFIESKSSSTSSTPTVPLQGIVTFIGPVSFAEGDDWIGIRLTGDSVGKGKNDGSVKGVQYFENVGSNNGMFVKASALKKRTLSRLEELRLKRELKTKSGIASPSTRRLSLNNTGDDDSSVSSYSTSATNRSSRLEEIRSRRLALQKNKAESSPSISETGGFAVKTPNSGRNDTKDLSIATPRSKNRVMTTPTTQTPRQAIVASPRLPSSSSTPKSKTLKSESPPAAISLLESENNHLRNKIDILNDKLQSTEQQNSTLQSNLDTSSKEIHELKMKINELNATIDEIQQDSEKKIASAIASSNSDEYNKKELNELKEEVQTLQIQNAELKKENETQKAEMQMKFNLKLTSVQESFEQDLNQKEAEQSELESQLTKCEGRISYLEKALNEKEEKEALREDRDSVHYKDRAKLHADILTWTRKAQEASREKLEMEIALEELTLDKDTLQQKCEEMEEMLDELKIDAESAQIEVDELKIELDSARERAEKAESAITLLKAGAANSDRGGGNIVGDEISIDAEEIAQALSIQNARLREAIIRLREQSTLEKMELTKQLRVAEKESGAIDGLKDEVAKLLSKEKHLKMEVNELKEMVDQGAAFERMVEEMSERVLAVEDNNITLQSDIRELEEAAELSAEMEEAQAEEIKALMKELQSRDTVVVNLEEAIKMQRKRELDFQRTIGNYRKSIETLQQEKNSLLALHEGGEGEKKNALIASQKALAQAAQSVADAALARKREATATFNLIDARVQSHLAERLEKFLPQNVASSEISAVKGELLLSKIAMKSSLSLHSLSDIFISTIDTANNELINSETSLDLLVDKIDVTSSLSNQVGTTSHEIKFAQLAIDISSECLRLLSYSQWPDILSSDASVDFIIAISQFIPQLDVALSEQLLRLKEEGTLSPHQSNLNLLTQSLQNVRKALDDIVNENEMLMLPHDWNPPTLEVMKNISSAKFACLGSASIFASVIGDEDIPSIQERRSFVSKIFNKLRSLSKDFFTITDSLSAMNLLNSKNSDALSMIVSELHLSSLDLFSNVEALFSNTKEIFASNLSKVQSKIDATSTLMARLLSCIRSQNHGDNEESNDSILSPELSDPWECVKSITVNVKSPTGDPDEINYVVRAKKLEDQLSIAIENDAKLTIANSKIRSLEKNLATRSKEISLQNGRLIELENMLSKSASIVSMSSSTPKPQEEHQKLKEEIRVLNEAMEVVQSQVDEYEKEIRLLKDPQRGRGRRAPGSAKKSSTTDSIFSPSKVGSSQKAYTQADVATGAVEAAIFRPALHSARSDASVCKSKNIADMLMKLPPLSGNVEAEVISNMKTQKHQLFIASAELRRRKASISIVDINGIDLNSRNRFKEERQMTTLAMERLQEVSSSVRFTLCSKLM